MSETWAARLINLLPERIRENAKLRLFGLLKIPVIFYVGARVFEINPERCIISIPLTRRTRNHYGSMYFGVLAVGADLGCGYLAQYISEEQAPRQVSLLFKDFQANFLKRPEGDVHFICDEGAKIKEAVGKTIASGERQNFPVRVYAVVPAVSAHEPIAEFCLTLSLKAKSKGLKLQS